MDEILASIRRILSEDEGAAAAPEPAAPRHADAEPVPDVLALDASMIVIPSGHAPPSDVAPTPPPPAEAVVHHAPPSPPAEAAHHPAPEPPHMRPEPVQPAPAPSSEAPTHVRAASESLVAPEAASAAATALGPLFRKLSAERSAEVYRGGPTLEDMVREEMRPMLKQWLDANLPSVVERLVRAEIDRVVNSAGS